MKFVYGGHPWADKGGLIVCTGGNIINYYVREILKRIGAARSQTVYSSGQPQ